MKICQKILVESCISNFVIILNHQLNVKHILFSLAGSLPSNIARSVPVSPGKAMIASGSLQPPVQKKSASSVVSSSSNPVSRPAPPPVPPNKPILPPNALKERGKELQQTAAVRAKILSVNKTQNHGSVPAQGENGLNIQPKSSSGVATLNGNGEANDTVDNSTKTVSKECKNVDINCKELADFHQMLASMEQPDNVSQPPGS